MLSVFKIQEFYPPITEKLLKDALTYAQRCADIKQNELDLIFRTRKSLLYCKDTPWIKKRRNQRICVTMGSNNVADVQNCGIVFIA